MGFFARILMNQCESTDTRNAVILRRTRFWIRELALLLLQFYKKFISPCLPRACRFEPTCSVYMYQAIRKKGLMTGIFLGLKRLIRCHPFCSGGFDPVP